MSEFLLVGEASGKNFGEISFDDDRARSQPIQVLEDIQVETARVAGVVGERVAAVDEYGVVVSKTPDFSNWLVHTLRRWGSDEDFHRSLNN